MPLRPPLLNPTTIRITTEVTLRDFYKTPPHNKAIFWYFIPVNMGFKEMDKLSSLIEKCDRR